MFPTIYRHQLKYLAKSIPIAALSSIASIPVLPTAPAIAQTSTLSCNNIYVSVKSGGPTNGYPVGKKIYQLNWGNGNLGTAQIGGDAPGVTGGIGIDPTTKLLYYIDGNGGGGYDSSGNAVSSGGTGRIWYFNGSAHTNTSHRIADPTAEHQAGMDLDGILWSTKWNGNKNLYRYDKTGNAVLQGAISDSPLTTEWSNLAEGDFVFDKSNKMWFVSTASGKISIWTIDRSTRVATKIGNYTTLSGTNHVVTGGAFGPDGKLYIGTSFGHIYKFDTANNTIAALKTTTDSPAVSITDMTSCLYPSMGISGKIWRDVDNSAKGTFNIITTSKSGTNAGGVNAMLIDSDSRIIATTPVATDGTYSFTNLSGNQSGLKIRLSKSAGTVGATAPAASLPTDWVNTTPLETAAFNSTTTDITNKYFGAVTNAKLLLVKRITAIKDGTTGTVTNFTQVLDNKNPDDPSAINDNHLNWLSGYLIGAYDTATAGKVKPGDEIEYTIYYLNAGGAHARNVKICDRILGQQAFMPNTYASGAGIQFKQGNSSTILTLTNASDASTIDRAQFTSTTTTPSNCNLTPLPSGTIDSVVSIDLTGSIGQPNNLDVIPGATSAGSPTNSYGWIRFKTKVTP